MQTDTKAGAEGGVREFSRKRRLMNQAVVGVRPELAEILDGPAEGSIEAEVYSVMPAGSETTIYLEAGGERILYRTMCSWWGMRRETVRPRRTTGYTIILSW